MFKPYLIYILLCSYLGLSSNLALAEPNITIFAAASLTDAVNTIITQYEAETFAKNNNKIKINSAYAASSTLAKQIENGAPADIFMAADSQWMNYLQDKKRINTTSRINLLSNRLVLIAPKGKKFKVRMLKTFYFASAFKGKMCTGDTESVPAGIYAKQALMHLNWWQSIKSRIVGMQDVRAALVFVERGECSAGIVYETDAKVSQAVEIVAKFPSESHAPIVYSLALVKGAKPEASDFFNYLTSPIARAVFSQYGFEIINRNK